MTDHRAERLGEAIMMAALNLRDDRGLMAPAYMKPERAMAMAKEILGENVADADTEPANLYRQWTKQELVARVLCQQDGISNHDAPSTKWHLQEGKSGVRVLPPPEYVVPAFAHYMDAAQAVLDAIARWEEG